MSPLKRLYSYASSEQRDIWLACVFSFLNKVFDLAPEVLIGMAVDTVVRRESSVVASFGFSTPMQQMGFLGVLTLFIWIFESLFEYLYRIRWRGLAQGLQHRLRLDAYDHVQRTHLGWLENRRTGDLMSILNDDINQLERFLDQGANDMIQTLTSSVLIGAIFFYIQPAVAVMAISPVPVILIGAYLFQNKLAPRYALVRAQAGALGARLQNNLSGISTIKSFTAENFELAAMRADSEAYLQANRAAIKVSSAFVPVIRMGVLSGFVVTLVYGGWLTFNNELAVGSYSVLVFLTQRLLWPFTRLGETVDLYQRAMASSERVFELLQAPREISDRVGAVREPPLKGTLRFDHVNFAYGSMPRVLHDITLDIKAGEFLGIVGSTGSGKSTLARLLLRLYEPTTGSILLDGQLIDSYPLHALRQCMGIVNQDVFLFHGTVRENIAYGMPEASMEAVIAAAKSAEAHGFIAELPDGYDTLVGERGQRLSGGQRQRISIARAVLKDPAILIMDEATSAVDNETEAAIQRSLERLSKGRTTLVIAHRLSTVRHADRIVVIDGGRVVEQGTHDVLLAHKGIYANLWDIQTGS